MWIVNTCAVLLARFRSTMVSAVLREDALGGNWLASPRAGSGVQVGGADHFQEGSLLCEGCQVVCRHERISLLHPFLIALCVLIKSLVFLGNLKDRARLFAIYTVCSRSSWRKRDQITFSPTTVARHLISLVELLLLPRLCLRSAWRFLACTPQPALCWATHITHSGDVTEVFSSIKGTLHAERSSHGTSCGSIEGTSSTLMLVTTHFLFLLDLLSNFSHIVIGHLVFITLRLFS